jgi:hypothetical protein
MWMLTWVGNIWHTFSSLPIWKSTNSNTWYHSKCHVYLHSKEWAYTERTVVHLYAMNFIRNRSLHDRRGHVFVANVVVIDPMQEKVPSSVISWPTNAAVKLRAITKICKYRGLHEGHHFILMAMEVHSALRRDTDCFIRECAHLFHDRQSRCHLSFFLSFNFSSNVLVWL